jgi:hypothetical protein
MRYRFSWVKDHPELIFPGSPGITQKFLWGRQGSNLRPRDYESPALTTELLPRVHPIRVLDETAPVGTNDPEREQTGSEPSGDSTA